MLRGSGEGAVGVHCEDPGPAPQMHQAHRGAGGWSCGGVRNDLTWERLPDVSSQLDTCIIVNTQEPDIPQGGGHQRSERVPEKIAGLLWVSHTPARRRLLAASSITLFPRRRQPNKEGQNLHVATRDLGSVSTADFPTEAWFFAHYLARPTCPHLRCFLFLSGLACGRGNQGSLWLSFCLI